MAKREHLDVIDIEPADVPVLREEGASIGSFLSSLVPFFLRASELETAAKTVLQTAKALHVPTNLEQDEAVVGFAKLAASRKREVEQHWGITQTFSAFHKRLVAARNRAVGPLEDTRTICDSLHNAYVAAERRRVADKNDQVRREAEAAARVAQEAEAARLRALAKEAPKVEAKQLRDQAKAVVAAPVVVDVPLAEVEVATHGRTTWKGEVVDAQELLFAWKSGTHGIPADVFMVDTVKLNEYARSLQDRLNKWPGVRAVKTTRV